MNLLLGKHVCSLNAFLQILPEARFSLSMRVNLFDKSAHQLLSEARKSELSPGDTWLANQIRWTMGRRWADVQYTVPRS